MHRSIGLVLCNPHLSEAFTQTPMIKVASYNIRKGVGTDRIRSPERILAVLH